jgi:hypothetical protein
VENWVERPVLPEESTQVALVFTIEAQNTATVHVSMLPAKGESEDLATLHYHYPADVNRYEASGRHRCQRWL